MFAVCGESVIGKLCFKKGQYEVVVSPPPNFYKNILNPLIRAETCVSVRELVDLIVVTRKHVIRMTVSLLIT